MVYKWFRNEFYDTNRKNSDFIVSTTYKKIDEEAEQISPGSDGLIMLPHLAGAFTPESNPHARAVFFGISLQTGRAHFARAILESVAFMLKRNINLLEELGIIVEEIHSIGGGSKSTLWNQIKADICQKPLVKVHTSETTSLGSAMLAGVALNLFEDLNQAVSKMSHLGQRIESDLDNGDVYSAAYKKYINLYNALESLF
jgi:xylulokinase